MLTKSFLKKSGYTTIANATLVAKSCAHATANAILAAYVYLASFLPSFQAYIKELAHIKTKTLYLRLDKKKVFVYKLLNTINN